MLMQDRLTVDRTWRTEDGYLGFSARFARTGIQQYLGSEIDPDGQVLDDKGGRRFNEDTLYPVYRDPTDVFASDALGSFIAKPITNDHPSSGVNVDNWDKLAKGTIGEVLRDGEYARMSGLITDSGLISDYERGKRDLSGGYRTDLDIGDGVSPAGENYVAKQVTIRGNHVAVVRQGRAGPDCRINDAFAICDANPNVLSQSDFSPKQNGGGTMPHTLTIDGLQVPNVSDEAKACIEKLQGQLSDATTAASDAAKEHTKAIAKKDAEIDDLKSKVLDDAAIDALADEKSAVVADAKSIAGDKLGDTKGKSVADVRRMAVVAKLGDADMADKTDDYIEARFDMLKDSTPDRTVVPISQPHVTTDTATIRDAVKSARYA